MHLYGNKFKSSVANIFVVGQKYYKLSESLPIRRKLVYISLLWLVRIMVIVSLE